MTNDNIRYDRQQRIKNWDQNRLTDAKVAIIGSGPLSQFTAASLAALGIGNIEIYDDGVNKGFLTSLSENYENQSIENILQQINSGIKVKQTKIDDSLERSLDKKTDLILDLTNTPDLKDRVMNYASSEGISVISASTDKTGGALYYVKPGEDVNGANLSEYAGETQGNFSSELFGGMITEETRKHIMPLADGEKPIKKLVYNATVERRFNAEKEFDAQPYEDISQKRILIVGAGALGNFVALGAALEGFGYIDILDYDEVEDHNLNRQILFYDAVGKAKSAALAEKIKKINPNIHVEGLVGKLDENSTYFSQKKPDLIFDCVDKFSVRAIINYFAVHYSIPLVSGGTNAHSGQVVVYEPGQSACLDCKMGVEKALGISLQGNKCTDEPDPSVIMTNEVIGGMMIGEALKVIDKGYGAPVSRILKYDANVSTRGGLVGASNPCDCSRSDIHEWLCDLKEKYASIGEKGDGS